MNPVLQADDVAKSYTGPTGTVRALEGVSFSIDPGEFVSVCGPSGCGKTTLLLLCGGLLRPTSGRILLHEQDLYACSSAIRARQRAEYVGFVFQQFHLVPYLNVSENILAPVLAKPHPAARGRAQQLIDQFGLSARAGHLPSALSTGERQRAALARALLHNPKLLLADEPTGNLDTENRDIILNCLTDFAKQGGAVLLVTHDPAAAARSHRTLKLSAGRLNAG